MSKFSELELGLEEAIEVSNRATALANEILGRGASMTEQNIAFTLKEAASAISLLAIQIEGLMESPTKAETIAKFRLAATVEVPWYMMDMKVSDLAGTAGEDVYDI
jgi:hypothetical protein